MRRKEAVIFDRKNHRVQAVAQEVLRGERMPRDDEYYPVDKPLPGEWQRYDVSDAAAIITVAWRVGILHMWLPTAKDEPIEYEHATLPFWVCVLARVGAGNRWRVLRRAQQDRQWRDAVLAFWRMAGTTATVDWMRTQMRERQT